MVASHAIYISLVVVKCLEILIIQSEIYFTVCEGRDLSKEENIVEFVVKEKESW